MESVSAHSFVAVVDAANSVAVVDAANSIAIVDAANSATVVDDANSAVVDAVYSAAVDDITNCATVVDDTNSAVFVDAANSAAVVDAANSAAVDDTTNSASVVSAVDAGIKIIANDVIRPAFKEGGSILRALLMKDVPISKPAENKSKAEGKINLLEGLGDDFLALEPVEIAPIEDQVPFATEANTTPAGSNVRNVDEQWEDIETIIGELLEAGETPTAVLRRTSPVPSTPWSHFSQASSTFPIPGTLPDLNIFSQDLFQEEEGHPLIPVLSGGKRKSFRESKGRKMFKSSHEESPSSTFSQLFPQPEHKELIRNYHSLISQVEEQRRIFEVRERESQKKLTSLASKREEVEVRRTRNRDRLRRFLEQFHQLQQMIERQKMKCREDDDLVRSLSREETEVRTEHVGHLQQIKKHRQRLAALRDMARDP